jgi:DNA-binding response OmpR family regulator
MRILVIEDDRDIANMIRRGLSEEGYAVDIAYDGIEGEYLAETIPYDVIVLDIILPRKDGLGVCLALRQKGISTRILMLTCKGDVRDRVDGLDAGADDYMVKPFDFDELSARIRALLRREVIRGSPVICAGDIVMNTVTRQVSRGTRSIELTAKEYAILECFMSNPNMVVTRRMIENHVWNLSLDSTSNLIDVYIGRLRTKLNQTGQDDLIETIRGAGYRLKTA